ncbi:MAG: ATP-binding cassette domain-containing protein [Thermomicrobium sp.]|nr:ATP-binding cassette domain-containing protein [Thermomicrobium sp.]MDW8005613.1 ATP-binding cassette domain-containing protein [Thermomicrobium sp.]
MIEITRLRYRYPTGTTTALAVQHWRVGPGEFVVLAGQSGSGKSTLLRSLVGLVPHFYGGWFGGQVTVGGRDTRRFRPSALADLVGYIGQEPETQVLLDRVRDEVAFALENLGFPAGTIAARVEEALDLLGIAHLRDRPIETLSGGERQRVTLAAALALRPRVLVLDEPTSQLDPWTADSLVEVLRRLVDDGGITVILAEHRLDRLLASATRVTILERGTLVHDGTPHEAVAHLPEPPLLVQLSQLLGWKPPVLSVAEAKRRLADWSFAAAERPLESSSGEPVVVLERVTCRLGHRQVLDDVSVAFASGQVTVIVGRNGAGKTTLLRVALGLQPIERGQVRLLNRPLRRRLEPEIRRAVAYVPQFPAALLLGARIAADLTEVQRLRGASPADVQSVVEVFDLAQLLEHHPADLSSGERQRAALAVALVGEPRLILLDEPTRGLGYQHKERLAAELRRRAAAGATIVVTTHDVDFAALVADRVVLLADGRVVADGPPERVLGETFAYAPLVSRIFGPAFRSVADVAQAVSAARLQPQHGGASSLP